MHQKMKLLKALDRNGDQTAFNMVFILSFSILVASLPNSGEIAKVPNNFFFFHAQRSETFSVLACEE